ncbi:uncharacterized protein LOC126662099 [Mercurialis annua]|uniref:uncharacterized protein LOC126662099 n=1 Tax=Mercurialis annua TaxID=3986 RepID=UPI00215E5EC4|nr:uncharacterized protein LOC126662099 [Mercurialis annua]
MGVGSSAKRLGQESGWVKVNSDATIDSRNNLATGGSVFRDITGQVLKVEVQIFEGISEAETETAELLALRFRVKLATDLGFDKVHFESDASLAIHRVNGSSNAIDHTQLIAEDIVSIGNRLESTKFSHVRRSGNRLAHAIASWGLHHRSNLVSDNVVAAEMQSIVMTYIMLQ